MYNVSQMPSILFCIILSLITDSIALSSPESCRVSLTRGEFTGDSIACLRRGETYFVSVKPLTEANGGMVNFASGTLTLTHAGKIIELIIGSPFCRTPDGAIWQLPIPVEEWGGDFYVEVQSLAALLNSTFHFAIAFDAAIPRLTIRFDKSTSSPKDDQSRWALDLVVIDPGHGGKDPGAVGATGLKEKDVTLDVGLRLNQVLQKKNIKTVMTRSDDTFIALSDRTSIANKASGKLFISLHCNSAKQRKAKGMETYFLAPSKTERAMQVALLENEAIRFEDTQDRYRELTEESYILMTMTQATFTQESELLAGMVQETVSKKAGSKDRGVDQAGFYVLIGASMPAILFEIAFISNREEEKKLKDKKFRQKIAEEIGGAILKFIAGQEQAPRR